MIYSSYSPAQNRQAPKPGGMQNTQASGAYTPSMSADGDSKSMNLSRPAPTAANWDFYNASKQARQQNPAYGAWNPSNATFAQGGGDGAFGGPTLDSPPAPMTRQQREDDIYNQLMAGDFGGGLKRIPSAAGRRAANAREVAKRLNAAGTANRYFEQYGVRRPGQAQPAAQPSQGTPYNPQNPPDFEGPLPGPRDESPVGGGASGSRPPARPSQGSGSSGQTYGQGQYGNMPGGVSGAPQFQQPSMFGQDPLPQQYEQAMSAWMMPKQQLMQWGQQQQNVPWGPNYGNTPGSRPPPFTQNIQSQFGSNPTDMWNNIGGFIQSVNQQASQQPVGVYQGQGNPGPSYAKMNYNIPQLAQQGQQMVQNGWQNPFMQGGAAQPQLPTSGWSLQKGPAWAGYPQ